VNRSQASSSSSKLQIIVTFKGFLHILDPSFDQVFLEGKILINMIFHVHFLHAGKVGKL